MGSAELRGSTGCCFIQDQTVQLEPLQGVDVLDSGDSGFQVFCCFTEHAQSRMKVAEPNFHC